jgi:hypothetical protein
MFNIVDPELAAWVSSSPMVDIEMALQVGWRNVPYARTRVSNTTLAVEKGRIGEDHVEKILRQKYQDVVTVSSTPMSGDITLFVGPRKTTVEVKNYTNPVPSAQVQKFQRDLSASGSINGVFISLNQPIATVTSDFKFVIESIDGRSVPCVYVVSNSPQEILCAVSMVHQYTAEITRLSADTIARSSVVSLVREVSNGLDDLAAVRYQLQKQLGDIGTKLITSATNVMAVESRIRDSVQKLADESTEPVTCVGIPSGMVTLAAYSKLEPGEKAGIAAISSELMRLYGPESEWLITAKKCTHVMSGVSVNFGGVPKIGLAHFPPENIGALCVTLGKKFSYNNCLLVEIAPETISIIMDLLTPTVNPRQPILQDQN